MRSFVLLIYLSLFGGFVALAQAPAAAPKAYPATRPAARYSTPAAAPAATGTTGPRLKADGTPDKRYKAGAAAAAPASPAARTAPAATAAPAARTAPARATVANGVHLKADGTPDMRYKENRMSLGATKADGTPDMRYKANKGTAPR